MIKEKHPSVHHVKKRINKDKKLKLIFRFKYPKLLSLTLMIFLSYIIFSNPRIVEHLQFLENPSYPILLLIGVLFGFGFTAPIATGFILSANLDSFLLPAIVISLGSLLSDLTIFKFVKFSFLDEFDELEHTSIIKKINEIMNVGFIHKLKVYIFYSFVGFLIASPLPDEIGVSLMAGLTKINLKTLVSLSFILHAIGIIIIILI